jgi:hypothetical protein
MSVAAPGYIPGSRTGWLPAPVPKESRSACDEHRTWIREQDDLGRNAQACFQDLVEGFCFADRYNSVKRFARAVRACESDRFDLPGSLVRQLIAAEAVRCGRARPGRGNVESLDGKPRFHFLTPFGADHADEQHVGCRVELPPVARIAVRPVWAEDHVIASLGIDLECVEVVDRPRFSEVYGAVDLLGTRTNFRDSGLVHGTAAPPQAIDAAGRDLGRTAVGVRIRLPARSPPLWTRRHIAPRRGCPVGARLDRQAIRGDRYASTMNGIVG